MGGSHRSQGQGGQGPLADPVDALTAADFEARRDAIAETCDRIVERAWRVDQRQRITDKERSLLLKAAFLSMLKPVAPYSRGWLDEAVDRAAAKKRRGGMDRPAGYLHATWKRLCDKAARNFNQDLARVNHCIPRELLAARPPARASPPNREDAEQPGDSCFTMTPAQRAEARAVIAAAKAALAALGAKRLSNPQSTNPPIDPLEEPCPNTTGKS